MILTELPTDIILLVFPYLSAPDFLSFTSSTRYFLSFRQEPAFWRGLTINTFRIPPQPLLQADGARWQWLYKSLLTQTRVYTWGNNEHSNLGHTTARPHRPNVPRRGLHIQHGRSREGFHVGWPTQIRNEGRLGVVVDVQCGGWCTVLLNSVGQIYLVGLLNGADLQRESTEPTELTFPPGYPPTTKERYEPITAIRQYSVGRDRVLGISDFGMIWEWSNHHKPAQFRAFMSVDIARGPGSRKGRVTRVVAGWAGCSAYIIGTGIVFWTGIPEYNESEATDGYLSGSRTIPGTSYQRSLSGRLSDPTLEARTGEVISHIVLDHYIVFITHLNKVFVYPADVDTEFTEPVELTTFYQDSPDFHIEDIQGSFRNFGIFSRNGVVLLGDTNLLLSFIAASRASPPQVPLPQPRIVPALQNASVISLAFGDYHYHALHADGTITSYGTQPKGCGALGLGPSVQALLRGVRRPNAMTLDETIETPTWSDGRRTIWFEADKLRWLKEMTDEAIVSLAGQDESDGRQRMNLTARGNNQAIQVFGEWFEREGRAWHLGPPTSTSITPGSESSEPRDHTDSEAEGKQDEGAFFALKISAAGWHSGALVLVDPDKALRVRRKHLRRSPAPGFTNPSTPSAAVRNENANGEETAGQEIASPGEQLVDAVQGVGTLALRAGRWFLGLEARDAAATNRGEEDDGKEHFVWEGAPLPRLRLPGGAEMPGRGPLTAWRGGEPNF